MIVDTVAQEATRTQRQYITVTVSGVPSLRRMWDVDADGLLDQDPTSASAASGLKAVAPADYRGFVVTTGINLPDLNIGTAKAVVDAWEQPLRIIYRQGAFGNSDFGIYSIGPDGVAAPDDAASDDICSWRK
jgi:hypothetical protein